MSQVAVILRSYNEDELIERCLAQVCSQDYPSYEVILVDSGSTDRTLEIARRFAMVKIVSIRKQDFTFGRALNIGCQAAAADTQFLAFLSAHAIPTTGAWLRELVTPMIDNPRVAGCFGKQTPLPEHMSNRIVRELARRVYPRCYGDEPFITDSTRFFSNANAAVRYDCWQSHPYDEAIVYAEDTKWAKQVLAKGWSLAYAPEACVLHSHPDTIKQFLKRRRSEERGNLAFEEGQPQPIPLGAYAREMSSMTRVFLSQVLRRRARLSEALDSYVLDGVLRTAAFLERRKLPPG